MSGRTGAPLKLGALSGLFRGCSGMTRAYAGDREPGAGGHGLLHRASAATSGGKHMGGWKSASGRMGSRKAKVP